MFEIIAKIVGSALSIWEHKTKNKYVEEYKSILEDYYGEIEKPSYQDRAKYPGLKDDDFRDNSIIDRTERRMYILSEALSSAIGGTKDLRDLVKP